MNWTEVPESQGGDFIKFATIGQSITGWYRGSREKPDGKYGPETILDFKGEDGKNFSLNASHDLKRFSAVPVGSFVRVTYREDKPLSDGRNPLKLFKIEIADGAPTPPPF